MKSHSPVSLLIAGSIIAAVLCTLLADGGWWLSLSVALAIIVVLAMKANLKR